MRRLLISIGGMIALYGAVAWAFALPPFKPAPVFYENVPPEGETYTCNSGEGPSIFIRFEQRGQIAEVRAGARTMRLAYKTSDFISDIYQSGLWRLSLDAEANLTGPNGLHLRGCY